MSAAFEDMGVTDRPFTEQGYAKRIIAEGQRALADLVARTYKPESVPGELHWQEAGATWLSRPSLMAIQAGRRPVLYSYGAVRCEDDEQRFFEWDMVPPGRHRPKKEAIAGLIREVKPGAKGPLVRTGAILETAAIKPTEDIVEHAARELMAEPWTYNPYTNKAALIKRITSALVQCKPLVLGQHAPTRNRLKDRREIF